MSARAFALVAGAVAVWGFARGMMSVAGIHRLAGDGDVHWTDTWFYGVSPAAIYVVLGAVALAFWNEAEWARYGVAAVVVALILLSVRNEWDLITWLAPRPDHKDPSEGGAE